MYLLFSVADPSLPLEVRPKRESAVRAETFFEDFLGQEEDFDAEPAPDDLSDYWPETGLLK